MSEIFNFLETAEFQIQRDYKFITKHYYYYYFNGRGSHLRRRYAILNITKDMIKPKLDMFIFQ